MKKSQVHYVLWELTRQCNLNCIHCRADAFPKKKDVKKIIGKQAKKLIDNIALMGCPTLALTGGEPLLRNDIVEIVRYATLKGIKTRIQSNAQLLTKNLADELKEAGLFSYGIGLDGSSANINDYIRNKKGVFRKSVEAIKILKKRGFNVHVEFTITKININEIPKTLDFLEKLGVNTFLARAVLFSGRANKNESNFQLSPKEYRKTLNELKDAGSKKRKIISNCQDPLFHLIDKQVVKKLKQYGDIYSGKIISGCTAGINMIHIHVNGDVGICTFLPDIILGNIFNNSLMDIWDNRESIEVVKKLIHREYVGLCGRCKDRFICGGCRARALQINGNLLGHDPYCWKYLEDNDKILKKIKIQNVTLNDFQFIHDVSKQNMEKYVIQHWGEWNEKKFKNSIDLKNIKVVYLDKQKIGFFSVSSDNKKAYLHNMQLVQLFHKKGIGGFLINFIEKKIKEKKIKKIKLQVFLNNPAVKFYQKMGYVVTNSDQEVAIMEKKIF